MSSHVESFVCRFIHDERVFGLCGQFYLRFLSLSLSRSISNVVYQIINQILLISFDIHSTTPKLKKID